MSARNVVNDVLRYITDVTDYLDTSEKLMVLSMVSEHCKAHVNTVLAHEYHKELYERGEVSERDE